MGKGRLAITDEGRCLAGVSSYFWAIGQGGLNDLLGRSLRGQFCHWEGRPGLMLLCYRC